MAYPGRIRLVKGAFLESEQVAYGRNSPELAACYRRFATELLTAGYKCSIATHDRFIQRDLTSLITQRGIEPHRYEFESLIGLGTEQIDGLRDQDVIEGPFEIAAGVRPFEHIDINLTAG